MLKNSLSTREDILLAVRRTLNGQQKEIHYNNSLIASFDELGIMKTSKRELDTYEWTEEQITDCIMVDAFGEETAQERQKGYTILVGEVD